MTWVVSAIGTIIMGLVVNLISSGLSLMSARYKTAGKNLRELEDGWALMMANNPSMIATYMSKRFADFLWYICLTLCSTTLLEITSLMSMKEGVSLLYKILLLVSLLLTVFYMSVNAVVYIRIHRESDKIAAYQRQLARDK